MMRNLCARVLASSAAIGMCCAVASAQITIPTVTIGDPGNAPDTIVMTDGTSGYGSVAYTYNISATEVTNAQYAAFLNAVAMTDTFGLYDTSMADSFGGIERFGSPGSHTYGVMAGRGSFPVNYVSFWDACRFANWLHNGEPTGPQDASTTEDGAYALTAAGIGGNTITRNTGWRWAVTSEDEWYKAAYHQPVDLGGDADDYWLFPTSSNSISTDQANYFGNDIFTTTPVASYAPNFYGAYDMGGNVWEWNESVVAVTERSVRGGAFGYAGGALRADSRGFNRPTDQARFIGFRVSGASLDGPCLADYNGTPDAGDILDFLDFIQDFSTCEQQPAPCGALGDPDLNGDTVVDILDFLDFLDAFGQGC